MFYKILLFKVISVNSNVNLKVWTSRKLILIIRWTLGWNEFSHNLMKRWPGLQYTLSKACHLCKKIKLYRSFFRAFNDDLVIFLFIFFQTFIKFPKVTFRTIYENTLSTRACFFCKYRLIRMQIYQCLIKLEECLCL